MSLMEPLADHTYTFLNDGEVIEKFHVLRVKGRRISVGHPHSCMSVIITRLRWRKMMDKVIAAHPSITVTETPTDPPHITIPGV